MNGLLDWLELVLKACTFLVVLLTFLRLGKVDNKVALVDTKIAVVDTKIVSLEHNTNGLTNRLVAAKVIEAVAEERANVAEAKGL